MSAKPGSKKKADADFSEISSKIFEGRFESLPEKVTLDLRNVSKADFNAILELARYKAFGHPLLEQEDSLTLLQDLQRKNNAGHFSDVIAKTGDLSPSENPDILLEKGRALVFSGRYRETVECLGSIVAGSSTSTLSRGVSAQMMAHALIELGDVKEASGFLDVALNCADRVGNSVGKLSALFFQSRLQAFAGEIAQAESSLARALEILRGGFGGTRWYLGFYRHLSHAQFIGGNPVCIESAGMAARLARSFGDGLFHARGILEILLMAKKFDLALPDSRLLKIVEDEAAKGNKELQMWRRAVVHNDLDDSAPQTLKEFVKAAGIPAPSSSDSMPLAFDDSGEISWSYDSRNGIFADFNDKNLVSLPAGSRLANLIVYLNRFQEGVPIQKFFEENWGVTWSEERHKSLLAVTLSRLNKISPSLQIERVNKCIRICSPGRIF